MNPLSTSYTPKICPRCKNANQCAIANNIETQPCWCMELPATSFNDNAESCFCAQCLADLKTTTTYADKP